MKVRAVHTIKFASDVLDNVTQAGMVKIVEAVGVQKPYSLPWFGALNDLNIALINHDSNIEIYTIVEVVED